MANKMLIDASHPEETRVVVLRGNRVEEFDFESANRKQLRGNIYLAKVTRVEPSLQAAFVDYGGNRHGFLAFSEIHPDYYQIPVADRQALIEEEERAHRDADAELDNRGGRRSGRNRHRAAGRHRDVVTSDPVEHPRSDAPESQSLTPESSATEFGAPDQTESPSSEFPNLPQETAAQPPEAGASVVSDNAFTAGMPDQPITGEAPQEVAQTSAAENTAAPADQTPDAQWSERSEVPQPSTHIPNDDAAAAALDHSAPESSGEFTNETSESPSIAANGESDADHDDNGDDGNGEEDIVETVGEGDVYEEVPERTMRSRRQYKIQEVIKRRQVMLVQVVKEERGTKGAALTTYLSLAGRYSVLMPNTARGGGISRKITSAEDRRRLKELAEELEVPEGMGVILRTAGANRTKTEIKRDFEYLLRLWETVRDLTLKSTAPMLTYEEGSLTKRTIRDLYTKDIDEVVVAGEGGYRDAKDFMRMLMPSHAKNVKLYNDSQPLFTRYGIEAQLDAMFSPVVQLKSGGYIVLNQTEALVAIDVNSGRATREHHIEDTALKTNLEAASEIARQLRLRDLAGLIVIDFIDMEEKRNNRAVERRLKEMLKNDRARIQVGRISHFGLLEMSRQRIRTSVLESSTEKCELCGGTGHVRSVSSVTLQLLRSVEEMLLKGPTHNLIVGTRAEVALYVLNTKRAHLRSLEERFQVRITVNADPAIGGHIPFAIERGEQVMSIEQAKALIAQPEGGPLLIEEDEEEVPIDVDADEVSEDAEPAEPADESAIEEIAEETDRERPARRRRGRGRRPDSERPQETAPQFTDAEIIPEDAQDPSDPVAVEADGESRPEGTESESERRRRRRGRRGGRRNRRDRDASGEIIPAADDLEMPSGDMGMTPDLPPPERDIADATYAPRMDEPTNLRMDSAFTPSAAHDDDAMISRREPAVRADDRPAVQHMEPPGRQDIEATPPVPLSAQVPAPREAQSVEPKQSEPPRRRSTIREPAPVIGGEQTVIASTPIPKPVVVVSHEPAPAPTEPAPQESDAGKPRRTGWWARRLAGGDSN
jgi:ribonuclease E